MQKQIEQMKQVLVSMTKTMGKMNTEINVLKKTVLDVGTKCAALELISVRLISKAISKSDESSTYEAMQVYASALLEELQKNPLSDTGIAEEYLETVLQIRELGIQQKPVLRLVQGGLSKKEDHVLATAETPE